jgi:hypothetical protein
MIDSHARLPGLDGDLQQEALATFALELGFGRSDLLQLQAQAPGSVDDTLQLLLARGRTQRLLPSAITLAELGSRYRMLASNLRRMQRYRPGNWHGQASYYRASAAPARGRSWSGRTTVTPATPEPPIAPVTAS